jgi:hypothetical protein
MAESQLKKLTSGLPFDDVFELLQDLLLLAALVDPDALEEAEQRQLLGLALVMEVILGPML